MVRGIRGAITVNEDHATEIISATDRLLREMIASNTIEAQSVAQILISVTSDITAAFPAAAVRNIDGWSYVPVMCMQEIPVQNSLEKCIRVMMTVNTSANQQDIKHVYLENARVLRPDL